MSTTADGMRFALVPPHQVSHSKVQQTSWQRCGRRVKAAVLYLNNQFGCSNGRWRDEPVWLYRVNASCHTCWMLVSVNGSLVEVWLDEQDIVQCKLDPEEVFDCLRRMVSRQKRAIKRLNQSGA